MQSIKCVAVGDGTVGKTTLLHTFTTNTFPSEYESTVFDNYSALTTIDKKIFNLSLWDSAGQDCFNLRPLTYPQTDVFLVMFSVISHNSFDNVVNMWLPEIRHYCPTAAILLVGTKTDLRNNIEVIERLASKNQTPIPSTKAQEIVQKEKLFGYVECSAREMQNIKLVFDTAIRAFLSLQSNAKKPKQRRCSNM